LSAFEGSHTAYKTGMDYSRLPKKGQYKNKVTSGPANLKC